MVLRFAILLAGAAWPLTAQPRSPEIRGHVGSSHFFESAQHVTAGASYRRYFGKRGWALEPEYSFMTEGNHQDNMVVLNVVKDLTKPERRAVLYTIMGGGANFYRSKAGSELGLGAIGWGMGVKVWTSERFFVSPQFRIGREPGVRYSFHCGFARRRKPLRRPRRAGFAAPSTASVVFWLP